MNSFNSLSMLKPHNINKTIEKNLVTAKHIEDHLENNERTLSKILGSSEKLWFSRDR